MSIGQSVGQCAEFRELFDVVVARAVAEMRILGRSLVKLYHLFLLYVVHCITYLC